MNTYRMRQEEEKLKKRPSVLFRRSSQKKKSGERDEFETNADSEWIHYNKAPMAIVNGTGGEKRETSKGIRDHCLFHYTVKPIPPPRRQQQPVDLTNSLNFKHHLE